MRQCSSYCGNYSFGIKEHIVFPEINFDKVDRIRGMDITLVTNNRNKKATFALLEALNFPFIKKDNNTSVLSVISRFNRLGKQIK